MRNYKKLGYSLMLLVGLVLNSATIIDAYYKFSDFPYEQYVKYKIRNEKIVVSLTTTPYRIDKLKPVIDNLLQQNADIQQIYINIPYKFKRDNIDYQVPDWLLEYDKVTVLRTDDYGPATKLLPVLQQVDLDQETIIVTVDDDATYPQNLVLQLAYAAYNKPNTAIAISGVNLAYQSDGSIGLGYGNGFVKPGAEVEQVTIVEGFGGVAYRRKFFDSSIFAISSSPQECINSDDVYLSFYLARRNIGRQRIVNRRISSHDLKIESYARDSDALHKQDLKEIDRHKVCIAYLKQEYPSVKF